MISGAEAKREYLQNYAFHTKGGVIFADPDPPLALNWSSDGIEDIKHCSAVQKKEHIFPSLIVKQSITLPSVKDCLGVHTDGFIPKGTL
eukprot:3641961-Rhodomonas_salina.2